MKVLPILLWITVAFSIEFNNSTYSVRTIAKCDYFYNNTKNFLYDHPSSIVYCEGRMIIPQNNTKNAEITFHDMKIKSVNKLDEVDLYPITGCIKVAENNTGHIEMGYHNAWDVSQNYNPTIKMPDTILNGTFSTGLKYLYLMSYGSSLNFQDTHTCFLNGQTLQLFIKPTIYQGDVEVEERRFLRRKNQWVKDNWYRDNDIRFIARGVQPIFHCVTADKYPLQCEFDDGSIERIN